MSLSVIVGAALALLIGVSLGLLGGGGSILTVPLLVYVIGVPAHEAIALSLLVVGTTSAAALVPHARRGNLRWKTGGLFGAASMAGAYTAGKLAHHIPATALLVLFGAMMLVTAIAMMRARLRSEDTLEDRDERLRELPIAKILLEGLAVGAVTGLVGAGGGFLVVPALVILGKLPMRTAIGTSLLVIAMKSFAGFAGYAQSTGVDLPLAAVLSCAAIAGSIGGAALAGRVPQALLRRGFAWLVVVMAVFVLIQEIPRAFGVPVDLRSAWPIVLGASGLVGSAAIVDLMRRRAART